MNKLIIVILILLYSCESNKEKKIVSFSEQVYFTNSALKIINTSTKSTCFLLDINQKFPLNQVDVKAFIDSITLQNKMDTPMAAWCFVVQNTFHTKPFSQNQWLHNPFIFTNSAASGFCDDVATYLVKIWQELGYKARVIGLEGHVVAEVFHQGKWKLYDPDLRVFYLNEKKEVASLLELESDSMLYDNKSTVFVSTVSVNAAIDKQFKTYYLSSENNKDNSDWALSESHKLDSSFILPSKSSLSIYYNSLHQLNLAQVELTKNSRGQLNIPLVPFCIEGSLEYRIDDSVFILSDSSFTDFLDNYSQIEIISATEDAAIHYLINPYFTIFEQENTLSIQSNKPLDVEVRAPNLPTCYLNLSHWLIEKELDELMEGKMKPYFLATSNKNFSIDSLATDFEYYNSYYKSALSSKAILAFKQDIENELQVSDAVVNQILAKYYPVSTHLLYTCAVHNNKAFFINKLMPFLEAKNAL